MTDNYFFFSHCRNFLYLLHPKFLEPLPRLLFLPNGALPLMEHRPLRDQSSIHLGHTKHSPPHKVMDSKRSYRHNIMGLTRHMELLLVLNMDIGFAIGPTRILR